MEAVKGSNPIFTGSQLSVCQISRGTATLDHGFRIGYGIPCSSVLAPFQKELCTGPGFAHQVHFQGIDPAGTQTVGKGHCRGLAGNNGHGLGILCFIDIQGILRDLFVDQIVAFLDIAGKNGSILPGGEGADESIFGITHTVGIKLPSGNTAAVRHILDDPELTKLGILGNYRHGLTGLDGHNMGALVKDPIQVGCTLVHFLYKESTRGYLHLDLAVYIRSEGRTGQQPRHGCIGEDIILPAVLIGSRIGILLYDKVCLGDIGDGDGCRLIRNHIHIMIAHIQGVTGMAVSAVLLHQVPAGSQVCKGIGGIVLVFLGGAAADVVIAAIVKHLPEIDLPAQFHALTVGGCFSDCQITGPLGVFRIDGSDRVILGQGHIPLGSAAGSISVREYTFIYIEGR